MLSYLSLHANLLTFFSPLALNIGQRCEGSGLVFGVKNVTAPVVYRQAMTEVVKNLQFLGFKVRLLKPSRTTHPDKAMAKVYP